MECSWLINRGGSSPDGKWHCVQITSLYLHGTSVQACHQDQSEEARKEGLMIQGYGNQKVFFQTLWKETTDSCHMLVDMFLFARHTAHSPYVCASSQKKCCKPSVHL